MRHSGSIMLQFGTEDGDEPIERFYLVKADSPRKKPAPTPMPPSVQEAIAAVIKAYTRLETSHHSKGERAARSALESAARKLRLACATDKPFPKNRG